MVRLVLYRESVPHLFPKWLTSHEFARFLNKIEEQKMHQPDYITAELRRVLVYGYLESVRDLDTRYFIVSLLAEYAARKRTREFTDRKRAEQVPVYSGPPRTKSVDAPAYLADLIARGGPRLPRVEDRSAATKKPDLGHKAFSILHYIAERLSDVRHDAAGGAALYFDAAEIAEIAKTADVTQMFVGKLSAYGGPHELMARAIDPVAWAWLDKVKSQDPPHPAYEMTRIRQLKQARMAEAAYIKWGTE